MITFLFYVLLLWLAWRWLCRSLAYVETVPPPPPAMPVTIVTPSITIHVHVKSETRPPIL